MTWEGWENPISLIHYLQQVCIYTYSKCSIDSNSSVGSILLFQNASQLPWEMKWTFISRKINSFSASDTTVTHVFDIVSNAPKLRTTKRRIFCAFSSIMTISHTFGKFNHLIKISVLSKTVKNTYSHIERRLLKLIWIF